MECLTSTFKNREFYDLKKEKLENIESKKIQSMIKADGLIADGVVAIYTTRHDRIIVTKKKIIFEQNYLSDWTSVSTLYYEDIEMAVKKDFAESSPKDEDIYYSSVLYIWSKQYGPMKFLDFIGVMPRKRPENANCFDQIVESVKNCEKKAKA